MPKKLLTGPIVFEDAPDLKAGFEEVRKQATVDPDFQRQLAGYSLTTAEILYHFPDHPGILQTFIWQDYDYAPELPALEKFLEFWRNEIEAKIHSVTATSSRLLKPKEVRLAADVLSYN